MKLVIHDMATEEFAALFPQGSDDTIIISNDRKIQNCKGCYRCWLETPGKCVLRDGYENMGKIFSEAEEIIVISQCCYGGYSPFVKNVLDRSISYLLPFFVVKDEMTKHKKRYETSFALSVYFYGENISKQEMQTAKMLVKANCANFHASKYSVSFCYKPEQIRYEVENI